MIDSQTNQRFVVSRMASWLLALFLCVLMGLSVLRLGDAGSLVVLMAFVLFTLYGVTIAVARRREGSAWSPVTVFFAFTIGHAILGYLSAAPTTVYLHRPSSGIYSVFAESFTIVSVGISAMMLGFVYGLWFKPSARFTSIVKALERIEIGLLTKHCRVVLAAAVAVIVGVFWGLGDIPIMARNPGEARFLQFLRPEFRQLVWVQNRCIDIFQVTVPVVLVSLFRKRQVMDGLLVMLAMCSAVAVVQRGPVISILFATAMMLFTGRRLRFFIIAAPIFLALYLGTQLLVLNWEYRPESSLALDLYGQALPEVRDLAWFLSSWGDQRSWGATFLYAFIPLPSFLVTDSGRLRNITLGAIGVPLDSPIGGIRILFAGECFANFGYPGVVVMCFLYGLLCAWMSRAFLALGRQESPVSGGGVVLALIWVLLSFWLYLCGTNASGTIRIQLLAIAALWWASARGRARGAVQ